MENKAFLSFLNTETENSSSSKKQNKRYQGCNSVIIKDKDKRNDNSKSNQNYNCQHADKIEPIDFFFNATLSKKFFYERNHYSVK